MGSEGRRTARRPHDEFVCPFCGRPVGSMIRRRKVLGVFVPQWTAAPCRDPRCAQGGDRASGARESERMQRPERADGEPAAGSPA
ncbi:hypothetical protein [Streptomyces sp. NPDC059176]|uniref:hypothetical protein n=1 Tax=Streptomyces sp. NPDC059176 TaxID=3346758 RepID=UPI0036A7B934